MHVRNIKTVQYHRKFLSRFQDLPLNIQSLAKKKEQWFLAKPFDARLKTHKLKGELDGYWSYSVNFQYRILFRFIENDEVIYYDIGTHAIYG